MSGKSVLTICAAILAFAGVAGAIDRQAAMIDSLGFEGSSFNGGYGLGVLLWGENAVASFSGKWAIVAGLGGGKRWLDNSGDPRFLDMSIGVKHYPWELTGVSLFGTYTMTEWGKGPDGKAASLELKQRLVTADDPVSPYLKGVASLRTGSRTVGVGALERTVDYDVFLGSVGAGVEFMMRSDFAFVFEADYFVTRSMANAPGPWEGWMGGLYMKYYWD